jgi:hypothetical protein
MIHTFNITYNSIKIFEIVTGKDGVGCWVKLVERTRRYFQGDWKFYSGPMVLASIEFLQENFYFHG